MCNVSSLLWFVAVPACAPGSSTTGPGTNTVRTPRTPLAVNWLQVQLFVYTHSMSAILNENGHNKKKQRQRLRKWKKTWKKKRNDCNTCVLLTGVTELDCRSKACTAGSVVHICLLNPYFRSKATILKKSRSSLLFALRECVQLLQLSKE